VCARLLLFEAPYEIGTVPPLEPGPGPLKLATGVAY